MLTTERKFLSCILALNSAEKKKKYLSELGLKHFTEPECIELFQAICKDVISDNSKDYIDLLCDHLHGDELTKMSALLGKCYDYSPLEIEAIEELPGLIEDLKINSIRRMLKAS